MVHDLHVLAEVAPHACKMVPLLIEAGVSLAAKSSGAAAAGGNIRSEAAPLSEEAEGSFALGFRLLFTLLEVGAPSKAAARAARPLLLETLLLVQTAPPHTASLLVRKLIEHVVDALTSADDATTWPMFAKAGDGVASLPLSPLTAEVADVLALRSAGCSTQLLPAVQAVVATSIKEDGAELNALRGCVRWLLACDSLTRAELPGRRALRLTLEAAHAESQVSSSASALGQLASPLASVVSSLADPLPQAE